MAEQNDTRNDWIQRPDCAVIPLHNTRADEMWRSIIKHVDFEDKSVIDVGCGYGDFLWRAYAAGARAVFGYDNDKAVNYSANERLESYGYTGKPVYVMNSDVQNWNEKWPGKHDIAICTSVLPYFDNEDYILLPHFDNPNYMLECILRDSEVAVIECQYAGDGPGLSWLSNDVDMSYWLFSQGAHEAIIIGKTHISGRDKFRTIWRVE